MQPFHALYVKEYREHRQSFWIVSAALLAILLFPYVPHVDLKLCTGMYLASMYISALAAMSYAKEDEEKTARFLRNLPVDGPTILWAKLAWLATVSAVLLFPLLLLWGYSATMPEGVPNESLQLFSYNFFRMIYIDWHRGLFLFTNAVAWGFFWTTRWPSKLFATLLTWLSVTVTSAVVAMISAFFHGSSPHVPIDVCVMLLAVSVVVGFNGLKRCAGHFQGAEKTVRKKNSNENERKRSRLLTRLLLREKTTPFRAMLWQSVCQSKHILLFGLVMGVLFGFMQTVFGREYVEMIYGRSLSHVEYSIPFVVLRGIAFWLTTALNFGGFLVAIAVASAVFTSDQENRQFRAFSQRGVSPRLVWWSRILPFAAVYLIPLVPFILFYALDMRSLDDGPDSWPAWKAAGVAAILYLAPFCAGTFFSLAFRNILTSMTLVFFTWLGVLLLTVNLARWNEDPSFLFCVPILIGFLVASRLMAGDWLAEKPVSRRWFRPVAVLTAALLFSFVVLICTTTHV